MAVVVDPRAYVIGPAWVYYRAVGVLTPWTSAGATLDDAVMRITTEWFRPDNLSGVPGAVMGLDVLTGLDAEIEFTLGEIGGATMGLAIPGAVTTAEVHNDTVATPFSSTIVADTAAGVTTIGMTAVTNLAVGDFIRIGVEDAADEEYRQVTAIDTLDVSFRDATIFPHLATTVAVETDGDRRTLITAPTVRRQPDSAYYEWALVSEAGMPNTHTLVIPRGISQTENVEMTVADDAVAGVRITIGARYLGSDIADSPFQLWVPQAA